MESVTPDEPGDETRSLLLRAAAGDRRAEAELLEVLGADLRRLAEQQLQNFPAGGTLQPTALVNEAWLLFSRRPQNRFDNERAFLAFASRVMRNYLIDRARAHGAQKRAGNLHRVSLTSELEGSSESVHDLLDVEDALLQLEGEDPETARLVELRFYGGLSHPQIAEQLGWSLRSVERRWQYARAWLQSALATNGT